jgi:hypothetical protein
MLPRSFIRPVLVDKDSPFRGEDCALCKETFAPGDEIVICPDDGSRHHAYCWRANGSKCTAYGCTGFGEVLPRRTRPRSRPAARVIAQQEGEISTRSKVRTMPSSSMGCAQTCLIISIAIAIVLIAAGCFGLWAIADYVLIDVLGWQYRSPFTGTILPATIWATIQEAGVILLF